MKRDDGRRPRRRSMRLPGHDYRQPGAYFVTICTPDRRCLLGDVVDDEMLLSDAGQIVQTTWGQLPERFPDVGLDAFAVMPNHLHGIIVVGAQFIAPSPRAEALGAMNCAPTLGTIVRAFKARLKFISSESSGGPSSIVSSTEGSSRLAMES